MYVDNRPFTYSMKIIVYIFCCNIIPYKLFQEFFEKKRYQNKVKRFEKPSSPRKRKLKLSTDLLSLQAATFSAKKFSTTGKYIKSHVQGEFLKLRILKNGGVEILYIKI